MNQVVFNLENLVQLDFGKVGLAFNSEVERVVQDCQDRPGDEGQRKVSVTFNFKPKLEPSGPLECDRVAVECEVTSSIPKRRTRIYDMMPRRDNKLLFNPDLPLEPEESTLYDDTHKTKE